ncbi:MAG: DNA polymerase I [Armatimonadetes bacterium]|nr:DNA polymerase I [Armatimonadota bacterium]
MSDSGQAPAPPKLVLVDGYSLLFRAYMAPGADLSTSDGRPTGAVYGMANMLSNVVRQEKPSAICVAWDGPERTFRSELYGEYKAHRPPVAEDLIAQFPVARQLVDALGMASVESPGFEADDLIGTLSVQGAAQGYNVVIVTGDSDQFQLVTPSVSVRMMARGTSEGTLYDAAKVEERYGIRPDQVAEFKALTGDPSDNIPGVPGVGKVTAAKLLRQYGTLVALLDAAEELPQRTATDRKVRDALIASRESARLGLQLTTIRCDVPLDGCIRPFSPSPEDRRRLRELYASLEFRNLLAGVPAPPPVEEPLAAEPAPAPCGTMTVEWVTDAAGLASIVAAARAEGSLAVRMLPPHGPGACGADLLLATPSGTVWALRCGEGADDLGGLFGASDKDRPCVSPADVQMVLTDCADALVGHDIKAMLPSLRRLGLDAGAWRLDTMVAAYLLNPGRSDYGEEMVARDVGAVLAPSSADALHAAAALCLSQAKAAEPLFARLTENGLTGVLTGMEMPLIPVLAQVEQQGIGIDGAWFNGLAAEMAEDLVRLSARIFELAGEEFAIGSTQQLQRILFEKLQLPSGKKTKTGYSTGADILEGLAAEHEIARRLLEYREVSKLKSTYVDALPRLVSPLDHRIHTTLNQTVAATGRLSSTEPNLQNIPVRSEAGRRIRRGFVAPAGWQLLSCDYSQVELRVFAHFTQDPEMVRAFEADEDIHSATAVKLFDVAQGEVTSDMRRRAKTVNFAVIYGQGEFGLANTLGITHAEAKRFIAEYFENFPGVREYAAHIRATVRERGYVETLFGRRRYLPDVRSGNFNVRQGAERAAVNTPIQGTAADIMKLAMISVAEAVRPYTECCKMLLQVHDELLFEVRDGSVAAMAAIVVPAMEQAASLSVKLRVDAKSGPNWADMTPVQVDRGSFAPVGVPANAGMPPDEV